jgi:hypothetical protein
VKSILRSLWIPVILPILQTVLNEVILQAGRRVERENVQERSDV